MAFSLRPALPSDFQFAFEAKRDALGPYIMTAWGWDEAFQREHLRQRWSAKSWQVIMAGAAPVGTVSMEWWPSHMQFGEFYILKTHRGQGIGSWVLAEALRLADAQQVDIRLEYLKWNPVGTLYDRHGFEVVGESDLHYYMVRHPQPA